VSWWLDVNRFQLAPLGMSMMHVWHPISAAVVASSTTAARNRSNTGPTFSTARASDISRMVSPLRGARRPEHAARIASAVIGSWKNATCSIHHGHQHGSTCVRHAHLGLDKCKWQAGRRYELTSSVEIENHGERSAVSVDKVLAARVWPQQLAVAGRKHQAELSEHV
jgi:hypothetical protein